MSQGRHVIKVLGLSLLAALGLMAFAASAQAGEYKIEGNTLTAKGDTAETVSGTIAAGKLLVPGDALTIKCTGGSFSATILLGGTVHASILPSGCEAEPNGAVCKPFETKAKMETNLTADKGFIVAAGLGEIILMGTAPNNHYILISATAATVFWPKLCSLTLEVAITGSTVFFAPNALTMVEKQTVSTISQATLESLFSSDKLFYGTQLAWIDGGGTTDAILSGSNLKKPWGGE